MMKYFIILCALSFGLTTFAQDKKLVQKTERINGTLFLVDDRGNYCQANPKVVTIKKKNPDKPLGKDIEVLIEDKLGYIDIKVPEGKDIVKYVEELKQSEQFEIVEYIGSCKLCLIPNDSPWGDQWYIDRIGANEAWNITTGNPSIKVAVIDCGVDAGHPDLGYGSDNYTHIDINNGWDYINNICYTTPVDGHGTYVAGVLGAKTNNSIGMTGIAGGNNCAGITIIPYNIENPNHSDYQNYVDDAIIDAVDQGVKVINFSMSVAETSSINAAIEYAYSNGVTIVCPTGNGGYSFVEYPASHENTIAVGASNYSNYRLQSSNYGTGTDLVAPGIDIYSTGLNGGYEYVSGTSIAVPQVVGTVALMLSINPNLTPLQIRNILTSTTSLNLAYSFSNGWNQEVGYGRLNTFRAVAETCSINWNVSGTDVVYNSSVYNVSNLQSVFSVEWSLSGTNASCFTLQNNSPTTNQCTITRKSNSVFNGSTSLVLTAQIQYNGTTVKTITKNIEAPYIVGTSIPCNVENYTVGSLPTGHTVTWSLSGTGLTETPILPGDPHYSLIDSSNNYYRVTRTALAYAKGTITATISNGSNTVASLTKVIDTGINFSGTWHQGSNSSSSLVSGQSYIIESGQQITLQSSDFIGANISYTKSNMLVLQWNNNNGTITFRPVISIGANHGSVTVTGYNSSTCEAFRFVFTYYSAPQPFTLNVNAVGNNYIFSLQEKQTREDGTETVRTVEDGEQPWKLSIVQYSSGNTIYEGSSNGAPIPLNTSGWKSGLYIAVAKIEEQIFALKFGVK